MTMRDREGNVFAGRKVIFLRQSERSLAASREKKGGKTGVVALEGIRVSPGRKEAVLERRSIERLEEGEKISRHRSHTVQLPYPRRVAKKYILHFGGDLAATNMNDERKKRIVGHGWHGAVREHKGVSTVVRRNGRP